MSQALTDFNTVYSYAAGESPANYTTAGAGNLDTLYNGIFTPGIYQFGGALTLTSSVTLQGKCGDVFVFQIGCVLLSSLNRKFFLTNAFTFPLLVEVHLVRQQVRKSTSLEESQLLLFIGL